MPYIEKDRRPAVVPYVAEVPRNAGELNYQLTVLCKQYWEKRGPGYQIINDIVGALEGCKAEFQRRVVGKYEDQKIKQNGDVY